MKERSRRRVARHFAASKADLRPRRRRPTKTSCRGVSIVLLLVRLRE